MEAKIYITSLEVGAQPASVIAKKTGVKRGNAYNLLERMKDLGFVQEFIQNGVRHFIGCPPSTLLSMLTDREQEVATQKQKLERIVPLLENIRNPHVVQPKVRYYQGIEGIKEVYNDTLRGNHKTIYAICDWEHLFPAERLPDLHEWMWKYADRRAAKDIRFLAIANKSPESDEACRRGKKQKRTIKMLKSAYLPVEFMVYGNKIALMSTKEDMVGIIIEDMAAAETLRDLHMGIWPFLPEYKI